MVHLDMAIEFLHFTKGLKRLIVMVIGDMKIMLYVQ